MSSNPVSLIRFWGNAALIVIAIIAIAGMSLSEAYWPGWPWLIGAVAVGYAAISFVVHWLHPDKAEVAWDEQNMAAHRASLVFSYWAALAAFLLLLGAVLTEALSPAAAFFWMSPVLGLAPSVHYLTSVARGRAE